MSREYDPLLDRMVEIFSTEESLLIRASRSVMVWASHARLELQLTPAEDGVESVTLHLGLLRSELARLIRGGHECGLSQRELLAFRPLVPIRVTLTASSAFVDTLSRVWSSGEGAERIARLRQPDGFPALADLANFYAIEITQQLRPPHRRDPSAHPGPIP